MAACHVKIIDADIQRIFHGADDIRLLLLPNYRRAHSNHTDFFPAVRECTVFHVFYSPFIALHKHN